MRYLERKADRFLAEWRSREDRKPLIVKGARQIGKTETIRRFGNAHYANFIEINFAEEPRYRAITENGYSADAIVGLLSRLNPKLHFLEKRTLLFFDELQDFPEIATALKFFAQDGRYDVICSGSLLGVHYRRIASVSVGYKEDYEMQSMDFEEFLWALGYGEDVVEDMLLHMLEARPFSTLEQQLFSELFLNYCILGGMPEIVSHYAASRNFSGTLYLQRQLLSAYRDDVRKYAEGVEQTRIIHVFDAIPAQLAKENKKFQVSKVAKGARSKDYAGCIEWLHDAGIINICYCLHFPELPLRGNYDESKYKIYYRDTGLLVAQLDDEAQENLRANRSLGVYKGALYENFAGEALAKSGFGLYYYKREDGTLEEDFFVRTSRHLIPVEVKARNGRSQSLVALIRGERYADIASGIKFCGGNIGYQNQIYTFPFFCLFLLRRFLNNCETIDR